MTLVTCILGLLVVVKPHPAAQDPSRRWDELFTNGYRTELAPNAFLAHVIDNQKPGTALDIGMGQGRNALMLAEHGWPVTGFDISTVAVARARAAAAKRGLQLNAVVGDVNTFVYGTAKWDLVVGIYIHDLLTQNAAKVIQALKPGGVLVVEGFHRDSFNFGYQTNELLRVFGGLTILQYEDAVGRPDSTWTDETRFRFVRLVARKD